MSYTCVIVDDEPFARKLMEEYVVQGTRPETDSVLRQPVGGH